MSSAVALFVKKEILLLTEAEAINCDDTLSSMGFASSDFTKLWEKAKDQFPQLKNTKVTQWSLEKPVLDLLDQLSTETRDIK